MKLVAMTTLGVDSPITFVGNAIDGSLVLVASQSSYRHTARGVGGAGGLSIRGSGFHGKGRVPGLESPPRTISQSSDVTRQ